MDPHAKAKAALGADRPTGHVRLRELVDTFFLIGLTSYGGPAIVAQIRAVTVLKKKWLTEDEFQESLAFCQTLPGPIAVQTAAHVGWRMGGPLGALLVTVAYVLPTFVFMLVLSALYVRLGELPAVVSVLQGLRAVVVAIVMDSILSMARPALKDWRGVLMAAVAAAALLLGAGALPVLLGSALAATFLLWGVKPPEGKEGWGEGTVRPTHRWTTIATILSVAVLFSAGAAVSGWWNPALPGLALTMVKVDMLAFGGGYTAIALMHDQVVKVHPWLTSQEFLDGLALGQITPGPVMITATFVGYKVAGMVGALVATVGIFLPSWLLLALLAPQFQRMRSLVLVHRMVRGLLAAFVAMLVYVLWQVTQAAVGDWRGWLVTAAALAALRAKVPPLWVVGAGIVVSAILFR